jgi:hypothetical protein
MSARIRWEPAGLLGCEGYVGTFTEPAFGIYGPDGANESWLLAIGLAAGTGFIYGSSSGELKAEAERWLEEFVSSLGAIFPDPELPRCFRCDEPVTGTPVRDPEDRAGRTWCSEKCLEADAEASGGALAGIVYDTEFD